MQNSGAGNKAPILTILAKPWAAVVLHQSAPLGSADAWHKAEEVKAFQNKPLLL